MRLFTNKPADLWLLLRRVIAIGCLVVWVLGVILPVIPGWPALVLAIILLGRRDRMLRLLHLFGRRSIRWLRRHPVPPVRRVGRWLSRSHYQLRRAITPHLIAAERAFRRRAFDHKPPRRDLKR